MQFFLGVHHADMGWPLSLRDVPVCISANTLRERQGSVAFVGQGEPGWMLDSGAFTQVALNRHSGSCGCERQSVSRRR